MHIPGAKALPVAQLGVKADLKRMFGDMSAQLARVVNKYARPDGSIPKASERLIVAEAGSIVTRFFVGADGRNPFSGDGVTALARYPEILNRWIVTVQRDVIYAARDWMQRHIPQDVQRLLTTNTRRFKVGELTPLRIVSRNYLAEYEPAHNWVDPNGYVLSDRIWKVGQTTRAKIDAFLTDAIRHGWSASDIATGLEKFLLPDRLGFRTSRPYGRDASADAMRLARTEITHAHSQATLAAALGNPYVDGLDWALSARHPRVDICDDYATIGMGGERLSVPYPLHSARIPPAHPHCLCTARQSVSANPERITEQLRTALPHETIYTTPLEADEFLNSLLGDALASYLLADLLYTRGIV